MKILVSEHEHDIVRKRQYDNDFVETDVTPNDLVKMINECKHIKTGQE